MAVGITQVKFMQTPVMFDATSKGGVFDSI